MSVIVPHRAISAMASTKTVAAAKLKIMELVGPFLPGFRVLFNMVLVGGYIGSEMTPGGIIRPDQNKEEDVWQGKCGLVLKLGRNAFVSDAENDFYDEKVEPGDWCVYKVGDAWQVTLGGYPCRMIRDSSIRAIVDDPSVIV